MDGWKVSFFKLKENFNFNPGNKVDVNADAEYRRGEGVSGGVDAEVFNVGAEVHLQSVRAETEYGDGIGTVGLEGPNAGVDIGAKMGAGGSGVSAMVEASAAKAEATLGPAYVSANLNANTGVKLGSDGVQASFLGFGLTLGVGGRWTVDTPLGSVGAAPPLTQKIERFNEIQNERQTLITN